MSVWGTARNLPARFEVGQGSGDLSAGFEVGQDSDGLLGKGKVQRSSSIELFGKADIIHSVELLGKGTIRRSSSVEVFGKTEIQQPGSSELLGECIVIHSTGLLCNAVIRNVGSAALYARVEVGQNSGDLYAKFGAQGTQGLYAKGEVRQADLGDLHARAEVGQDSSELIGEAEIQRSGSVEILGKFEAQDIEDLMGKVEIRNIGVAELSSKVVVRNVGFADLLGKFEAQVTAELLGRAVIGHPAYPDQLKAIFSVGLTNAYRDLGLILEIGRAADSEMFGKVAVRHSDSADLPEKAVIRHVGSVELPCEGGVRRISSRALSCKFNAQAFVDLYAKMKVGPAKDSDIYIAPLDPSGWINEVMGIGQGFIAIPWVEADSIITKGSYSSAKITSTYSPGQYKEIKLGWCGMGWSYEIGGITPVPIDTGGGGPRRGSRDQGDQRREIPEQSFKDLAASFRPEQPFKDLVASFEVMPLEGDYTTWTHVWTRDYGSGAPYILNVLVDNSGTVYAEDLSDELFVKTYGGAETNIANYHFGMHEIPMSDPMSATGKYMLGTPLYSTTFDVWKDGLQIFSRDVQLDEEDAFELGVLCVSPNGKFIAIVTAIAGYSWQIVMLYEGS